MSNLQEHSVLGRLQGAYTILTGRQSEVTVASELPSVPVVLFHHSSWLSAHGCRRVKHFLLGSRMERKSHLLPGAGGGVESQ